MLLFQSRLIGSQSSAPFPVVGSDTGNVLNKKFVLDYSYHQESFLSLVLDIVRVFHQNKKGSSVITPVPLLENILATAVVSDRPVRGYAVIYS